MTGLSRNTFSGQLGLVLCPVHTGDKVEFDTIDLVEFDFVASVYRASGVPVT